MSNFELHKAKYVPHVLFFPFLSFENFLEKHARLLLVSIPDVVNEDRNVASFSSLEGPLKILAQNDPVYYTSTICTIHISSALQII